MLLRLLACVLAGGLSISSATAADFSFVDGQADPPVEGNWIRDHCNMRMTGEVVAGDTERFEALLAKHANQVVSDPVVHGNPRIVTLCLNSPGGSLAEAVKLAEAIRKDRPFPRHKGIPFVATRLEAGATCESACAIVFMAGASGALVDPPTPNRSMHPTARLGFHAPALTVGGGNYTQRHVNTAFDISIQSIAAILRVLHVGEDETGKSYGGNARWIEASLLEAMLRTPASSMRYVDTVDDAGRWDIPVSPIRGKAFDHDSLLTACLNELAWQNQRPAGGIGFDDGLSPTERDVPEGGHILRRVFFAIDEFTGHYCEITVHRTGFLRIDADPDLSIDVPGHFMTEADRARRDLLPATGQTLWLYDPQTRLAALAPAGEAQAASAPQDAASTANGWAPRYGGDKVTLWDHNGSQMAWESKGSQRWIWYYAPRAGLAGSGVVSGTLLFEGEMRNGELRGTARRFSKKCGDNVYSVKGRAQGTRVVLKGLYWGRDKACKSTLKQKPDTLTFDFISTGPEADPTPDGSAPTGRVQVTGVRTGLNMRAAPNGKAAKVDEVPAGQGGITLLSCLPAIDAAAWAGASGAGKRRLLAGSWCSLSYRGRTGFVSGKYLAPE
ncbi:hypothetical protein [Shimia sediminis]|uniref:hypothetical protein n=1 Tax=Shimia sediminis TaxID=2497945 RepID=UPI000F8F07D1|nr:hypothetical protein [Shimia sediminis]